MPDESSQHRQARVRPPRVMITTDLETNGSKPDDHLPLLVGIIADLSADSAGNLPALGKRQFVEIDRDNINDVMVTAAPTLNYTVPNTLTKSGHLRGELKFEKLSDFEPAAVAAQVPALKHLLDLRKKLDEALAKVTTNEELAKLFQQILADQEKARELAQAMNPPSTPDAPPATGGR